MNYEEFCKNYFLVTGVPVTLTQKGRMVYSSLGSLVGYRSEGDWPMYPMGHNPEFAFTNPDIEYGRIDIEGTELHIVLGPVFSVAVNHTLTRRYMSDSLITRDHEEEIFEALSNIPLLTHSQLARHMVFVCLCVNGKSISSEEIIANSRERDKSTPALLEGCGQIPEKFPENSFDKLHQFELELYGRISHGNTESLNKFMCSSEIKSLRVPQLALTPLRQAKNNFVWCMSRVVMEAAIPGGMSTEQAYELGQLYVSECEKLQSLEGVANLEHNMIFDICRKLGSQQVPADLPYEIRQVMIFIRSHIGENISIEEAANEVNRSVSYISRLFKKEMGFTIGAYISRCRIEESKELLQYTDMTLSEISCELGFSSQSYFQNVFKRQYGITPGEFRSNLKIDPD